MPATATIHEFRPMNFGPTPEGFYKVGDLGLAAFLIISGMEMASARKDGRAFEVFFRNPNPENPKAGFDVLSHLRMTYPNSQFARFDGIIGAIKKSVFGG